MTVDGLGPWGAIELQDKINALRKEVDPLWARDMRRTYLLSRYKKVIAKKYVTSRRRAEDLVVWAFDLMDAIDRASWGQKEFLAYQLRGAIRELVKYQKRKYFTSRRWNKGTMTRAQIEEARRYPMVDLLSAHGITLNRYGAAACPFHDDRAPSLKYYPNKNIVRCFSCNKSWNPVDFVMEKEGLSFAAAIQRLI